MLSYRPSPRKRTKKSKRKKHRKTGFKFWLKANEETKNLNYWKKKTSTKPEKGTRWKKHKENHRSQWVEPLCDPHVRFAPIFFAPSIEQGISVMSFTLPTTYNG